MVNFTKTSNLHGKAERLAEGRLCNAERYPKASRSARRNLHRCKCTVAMVEKEQWARELWPAGEVVEKMLMKSQRSLRHPQRVTISKSGSISGDASSLKEIAHKVEKEGQGRNVNRQTGLGTRVGWGKVG